MLDKKMFAEAITGLAELFDKKLSPAVLKIYYGVLKNMSEKDFKASIMKLMTEWSYNYMPKPAQILNSLVDKVSLEVEANNEWNLVMGAIEKQGHVRNVEFQNVATNGTIQALTGGKWSDLCKKTYKELEWVKKDFVNLYSHYRKNPQKAKTNMLLGLTSETKAVLIKSSVNDTKILKSKNNAIESKIDTKKQQLNNLISNSVNKF